MLRKLMIFVFIMEWCLFIIVDIGYQFVKSHNLFQVLYPIKTRTISNNNNIDTMWEAK